ncbi:hypothetical protein BDZ91DRAFT_620963, partial [Kalaharituber pfeilii]
WSLEEVQALVRFREQQGLTWRQVASHFHGKTSNACRKRFDRLKRGKLPRGPVSQGGSG